MACENDKCEKYGLHHDYKDGVEIRKCFRCEDDEMGKYYGSNIRIFELGEKITESEVVIEFGLASPLPVLTNEGK